METLTWKVDKTIPTACPDYQPDPYTGEYPTFHCLVYHCKTITESKTAEFETEEIAKEFISKAPLSCYEFKLNGELIEDKRERPSNITIGIGNLTGGNGTTNLSGDNQ
jgi:hypothetical protein